MFQHNKLTIFWRFIPPIKMVILGMASYCFTNRVSNMFCSSNLAYWCSTRQMYLNQSWFLITTCLPLYFYPFHIFSPLTIRPSLTLPPKTVDIFGVYRIFRPGCRQDGVRRPSLDENMAGAAPLGRTGAVDFSDPDGKRHMEAMRILNILFWGKGVG